MVVWGGGEILKNMLNMNYEKRYKVIDPAIKMIMNVCNGNGQQERWIENDAVLKIFS